MAKIQPVTPPAFLLTVLGDPELASVRCGRFRPAATGDLRSGSRCQTLENVVEMCQVGLPEGVASQNLGSNVLISLARSPNRRRPRVAKAPVRAGRNAVFGSKTPRPNTSHRACAPLLARFSLRQTPGNVADCAPCQRPRISRSSPSLERGGSSRRSASYPSASSRACSASSFCIASRAGQLAAFL